MKGSRELRALVDEDFDELNHTAEAHDRAHRMLATGARRMLWLTLAIMVCTVVNVVASGVVVWQRLH